MERQYSVQFRGKETGKVLVEKQGLYYRFVCHCHLIDNALYRLAVECDGQQEILGVLAPLGGSFHLERKIPAKRFGTGEMMFSLCTKKEHVNNHFVPISPDEPFSYISRLKDCFLTIRNSQLGILINETQEP